MGKVPRKPGVYVLDNGRKMRRFPDGHVEFLHGSAQKARTMPSNAATPEAPKRRHRRSPPSLVKRATRFVRKHPVATVGAAALVFLPGARAAAKRGVAQVKALVQ